MNGLILNKKRLIANLAILILVIMPVNISAKQDIPRYEILIGLIPEQNIFKQMDRYRPLASYLTEKSGVSVRLTILSRYGDVVERFTSRGMDGAFFDSLTAAMAMSKLGVEPVARPVHLDGSSSVRSYIFTRADSKIKTVASMKGKKVAFVDRATATGYLFAIAYLQERGINGIDRYFSEYFFTGSHDSAIYSVLDSRADIGTAQNTIFNMLVSKDPTIKKELNIIAQSEEFPETTLCLRKNISNEIRSRIQDVLLNMDQDKAGKEVLNKFGALKFIKAEIKDFSPVFDLAKRAKVDIRGYRGER